MVEEAKYSILKKIGKIEFRRYPELILATTKMKGEERSNDSFRIVAGYIFGKNEENKQIAMTAPVITSKQKGLFSMSFVMPSGYTMNSLPKPQSNKIKIEKRKSKKFAVITFSGRSTESNIKKYSEELLNLLKSMKMKTRGTIILMRYNPPWTLPFFRRNELALELI